MWGMEQMPAAPAQNIAFTTYTYTKNTKGIASLRSQWCLVFQALPSTFSIASRKSQSKL